MFSKKVDKRSRKAMIEFLTEHFRYSTMNSWNCSSSYAHCVKYGNLNLTKEQSDKFFEMLSSDDNEFFDCYAEPLIEGFREETGYTAGFNGRSGGYLVMYEGCYETLGYKSRCTHCYQNNYKTVEESGNICGRCGKPTRVNLEKPITVFQVYPGRSIDQDEDFEEWSLDSIRDRVKLVQRFDELCDDIRDELCYYLDHHEFVEEEYSVTKTHKVAKEIA